MNIKALLETIKIDTPLFVMVFVVLVSAVAVIYTKHLSRNEFVQLQRLEKERDALNEEWARLLLEESTWASPSRIEEEGKSRLGMVVPKSDMTVVIKP